MASARAMSDMIGNQQWAGVGAARKCPAAIVLGGTSPHGVLIENLKRRGYYVVLVDYLENPPAKRCADDHIRESTLDLKAVLRIATELNPALVISACVDQANITACFVAEKMGLPAPYSYETSLAVSHKPLMKAIMVERGIPTSRYMVARNEAEASSAGLTFPLVVKPGDGNGSKGVMRVDREEQLLESFRIAKNISRSGEVILEEFCVGEDVSADCFVLDGQAHLLMLRKKYGVPGSDGAVMNSFASLAPAEVSPKAEQKIRSIAQQIAEAFQLRTTSLLIQFMIDGERASVIEFAARVSGGLAFETVKMQTGFDLIEATVDSYLERPVHITKQNVQIAIITSHVYARPAVFGGVAGQQELLAEGVIASFHLHKTPGMRIGRTLSSGDRACSFIVHASDECAARARVVEAMSRITVLDMEGNDITRRDICLRQP